MRKRKIIGVFIIFLLCSGVLYFNYFFKKLQPSMEYLTDNIYEETLIVVADKDFEPYSFFNNKKEIIGYDIEIINSLSPILKKNINLKLLPWEECIEIISRNEADLILGMITNTEKRLDIQLSIPTSKDGFVLFGKKKYENFEALYSKKIAYLKGSDSVESFLKPYGLDKNAIKYGDYGSAFNSVLTEENDYVLTTYSVGKRIATKYKDIEVVGDTLVNKMFSIGVSKKNSHLIEDINSGIIQRQKDGTINYLKNKWLGKYVETTNFEEFLKQNNIYFTIFIVILFIAIICMSIFVYEKKVFTVKKRESELLENLSKDPLTKAYNRISGERLIEKTIKDFPLKTHVFMMVDIDNFKNVNEYLGHDGGDKVIKKVAQLLENRFNDDAVVIRMGGDEFSVFISNSQEFNLIEKKLKDLFNDLSKEITVKNKKIKVSLSIGIATYPKDGTTFEEIYEAADKSLYRAKSLGKGTYYTT